MPSRTISATRGKGEAGYGAKCDELRGFVFEPLRSYLRAEIGRAGMTAKDVNRAVGSSPSGGGMASHYIGNTGQWELPTVEHYDAIRRAANGGALPDVGGYLRREWSDLRAEYETLRAEYETLRRPFSVTADVPYTDVWDFPTVKPYPGKHPCEKPIALLRHAITASTRPDAVVLDCFAGSGATGEAAVGLGRRFIGIEIDPAWCERARARVGRVAAPAPVEAAPARTVAGGATVAVPAQLRLAL